MKPQSPSSHAELLLDSLPREFAFYHLGDVRLHDDDEGSFGPPAPMPLSTDRSAVALELEGDVRGVVVLMVAAGLDYSTYAEMGNVIASRMASTLGNDRGLDVAISPPRALSGAQLARLLAGGSSNHSRVYLHRMPQAQAPIALQTLVLTGGNIGNA